MSNNNLEFKLKEKTLQEKFKDTTGSDSYLCLWFNDQNDICYSFGKLSSMQLAYAEKTLSMIATETIQDQTIDKDL